MPRKPAAKKTTAKKSTVKKTVKKVKASAKTTMKRIVKKAAPKAITKALKTIKAKLTKTQIVKLITENVNDNGIEVSQKAVGEVFKTFKSMIEASMKKGACGEISVPEAGIKVCRIKKPKTKARPGRNPATGEEIMIAAKPARTVIKVRALKALKDTINA